MDKAAFLNRFNIPAWEESEVLEWKLSTREAKQIVQTIVAFSNTRGGVLLCGVTDAGEIVGQDISDGTLREITQTLLANTQERLYPDIERLEIEGKSVLSIAVNESPLRPHNAYGRPYKRIGPVNIMLDQSEYALMLGQKQNGGGADRVLCPQATLDDIDENRVFAFVQSANETRNLNIPVFSDTLTVLQSLELASGDQLRRGALLLFGKNPQKFMPQSEFRAAHFRDEKRDQFLAQRIFGGTLLEQFQGVLEFVKQQLPVRIDATLTGSRQSLALPLLVIQELLANAIVHRDYRDPASSYLNIIDHQRIEINNPGLLPAPRITPDILPLAHPSIPINRRIARVFFLLGIIEQWGEGTRRVCRTLNELGRPIPEWQSARGTVTVNVAL